MPDEPFVGELALYPYNRGAPKGWALCDGRVLQVNQNQALYALIGNQYGGTAPSTFALPDLRGRVPVHRDAALPIGTARGTETVALGTSQMPSHAHSAAAVTSAADTPRVGGSVPAGVAGGYGAVTNAVTLAPGTVAAAGSGQPHPNRDPYLALQWCIALVGIFPSRQ